MITETEHVSKQNIKTLQERTTLLSRELLEYMYKEKNNKLMKDNESIIY